MALTLERSHSSESKEEECSSKQEIAALKQALAEAAQNFEREALVEEPVPEPAVEMQDEYYEEILPTPEQCSDIDLYIRGTALAEPRRSTYDNSFDKCLLGNSNPVEIASAVVFNIATGRAEMQEMETRFQSIIHYRSIPHHSNQRPEGTIIRFPNSYSEVEAAFYENSELMENTCARAQEKGIYTGDHFYPKQLPILNNDDLNVLE